MITIDNISEDLLQKAKRLFESEIKSDNTISGIVDKLASNRPMAYAEANKFAIRAGEILSDILNRICTYDLCEGGRMPEEIAQAVIRPMLKGNYELVTRITEYVQKSLNDAAEIGLNPLKPPLNTDRVDKLVEKVVSDDFEKTEWLLGEPIINFSQSIVDDSIRVNADFQARSGLMPIITRTMAGNCCDWCRGLAGTFEYGSEPKDIYRRHRYCRCTVVYKPTKGKYQGAHSKKWYRSEEEANRGERVHKAKIDAINEQKDRERKKQERIRWAMLNSPENINTPWAKEMRRKQHIADYYKKQGKKK